MEQPRKPSDKLYASSVYKQLDSESGTEKTSIFLTPEKVKQLIDFLNTNTNQSGVKINLYFKEMGNYGKPALSFYISEASARPLNGAPSDGTASTSLGSPSSPNGYSRPSFHANTAQTYQQMKNGRNR